MNIYKFNYNYYY